MVQARTMRAGLSLLLGTSIIVAGSPQILANDSLYGGTVFISPDVLTPASPSDLVSVTYEGSSNKRTFDRRVNAWINQDSHVFEARFECGRERVSVVVNSELSREESEIQAIRFSRIVGQLPFGSRQAIHEIWIHSGNEAAGGGNNSILIHTEYADKNQPFLEEVILHESAHTSLDWTFGGAVHREKWNAAANADRRFISQYAADYPDREDVAESYGAFVLHEMAGTNPVLRGEAERIASAIPNRINYFRSLGAEFGPSRSACTKYGPSQSAEQSDTTLLQQRRLVLAERGKGVRLLGVSLSDNGDFLNARLDTKLQRGSKVRVFFGKGEQVKVLPARVGTAGRIQVKADVMSVSDVSIKDSSGKVLVRWRLY